MLKFPSSKPVLRIAVLIMCLVMSGLGQVPADRGASDPEKKGVQAADKDRGQILAELSEAQKNFDKSDHDVEARFRLVKLLFQAGDFQKAESLVQPLVVSPKPQNDALFLAADLEYLLGHYEKAEGLLHRIIALNPSDIQTLVKAQTKLVFVYYQTNQYEKTVDLFKGMEGKIKLPHWDLMKSFGRDRPYHVGWPEALKQADVPFLITDPLPIISVELQGRQLYTLIDTGADTFVLDNEIAASMGIKPIASMQGTFAGGNQAEVGFGRADTLKLGAVTLRSVPIAILPTTQFSKGFAAGQYTIGGIVGTGVLKQFLSTLDYVNGRLTLRRPDAGSLQALRLEAKGRKTTEIPFVLSMTHFMMAEGRLNDKEFLTFFVDSGLASDAAFSAPAQTLRYAGIPVPETKVREGDIGGGGGAGFATGSFPIKKLGLGPLVQENKIGDYGSLPPGSYWSRGFITDGLISHGFLRQYSWTIDFSSMKMIFVK